MAFDMRALYYIKLSSSDIDKNSNISDDVKANENCLNQNFTILAQAVEALHARVLELENNQGG